METIRFTGEALWQRMDLAVERVRDRLERAATAISECGIRYAIAGDNAVRAWVSQVDIAAVRNTQDVDIAIRRDDLSRVTACLGQVGFVYRHFGGVDMFLDGPEAKARDAIHIVFAGELVQENYPVAAPELTESVHLDDFVVLNLEALVRMKLTSFRRKDQVHLQDMLEVGLIDAGWKSRFPTPLAERLQEILDDPHG
jgi:hypothetical protein